MIISIISNDINSDIIASKMKTHETFCLKYINPNINLF